MDSIFGLSMDTIMVFFVIVLLLCLSVTAYVALRRPVVFKMGMRNIPRRKAQTALILVGLMLSTVISTAALGMGDTIDRSFTSGTYDILGEVDEVVVASPDVEGSVSNALATKMPASALQTVEQALADNPDVEGVLPALLEFVPVVNTTTELSAPEVYLVGIDPARTEAFGGLTTTGGEAIDLAALPANEVVISESTAEELDASAGDEIVVYYGGQPMPLTVAAVAENSPLSGVLDVGENPGMVVPLDRLQTATNQQDQLSFIGITNVGDEREGLDRTDSVVDTLEAALAGTGLGVDPLKQTNIELAEAASSGLTLLFTVLGLFSIAVGVLLIILIFSMLAAERRSEMGMARAVGQQRFQLIQQFIAEGSGYALLSGIVGVTVGVGVTIVLGLIFARIVGDFFPIEPYVTPRSVIIGYCLGVVLTFLSIVVASWRASRLNVVAAIRDLPDVNNPKRSRRALLSALAMLLVGAGAVALAYGEPPGKTFFFYLGMSLLPFGLGILARYFGAPSRPVFSIVGLYILVLWLVPADVAGDIFGDVATGGNFEMFFLSGIFMVAGATILIVQNLDLLLGGVTRLGGVLQSRLPAIRMGVAYPGSNKGRTGLTIAMFSLIVFSLVSFATISENFSQIFINEDADAGWDVEVNVASANQIPDMDIVAALAANGVDTSDIEAVSWVQLLAPSAGVKQITSPEEGFTPEDEYDGVFLNGASPDFFEESILTFQSRAEGYADDQAIIDALLTQPNVAVIDASATAAGGDPFGGGGFTLEGVEATDDTFAPIEVEILGAGGQPTTVTIIGVIDQDLSTLFGMYMNAESGSELFPTPAFTEYEIRLSGGDTRERAQEIESALLMFGAQAQSYDEILEESQGLFQGFLTLIQGFMGLGLVVGIAAVGVIAFRAVVERRQQIGMLRAIGYQKSMVSLSFIIETIFVVGLGVISGTLLAIALAYSLFQDEQFTGGATDFDFVVPWTLVTIILAIAFGFALLMTWLPSQQASRIRPAEALRYE